MRTSTRSRTHWSAPRAPFPHQRESSARAGAAVYRRREPTATPLYPIVQHHLETFLAEAAEADPGGEGVPGWVEDDFRAYLRCGILAHGFARVGPTGDRVGHRASLRSHFVARSCDPTSAIAARMSTRHCSMRSMCVLNESTQILRANRSPSLVAVR